MILFVMGYSSLEAKAMMSPEEVIGMIIKTTEQIMEQEEKLEDYDKIFDEKIVDDSLGQHVNPAEVGDVVDYSFIVMDGEEEVPLEMQIRADIIADEQAYDYLGLNDTYQVIDKSDEWHIWVVIDFELKVADSDVDVTHTIDASDFDLYFANEPDLRKNIPEERMINNDELFKRAEVSPGDTIEGQIVKRVPNYTDLRVRFGTGERKSHVFWYFEAEENPYIVY